MGVLETAISVGGSLLGGLFGKKKTAAAPSAYQQTMEGIKGQAEGARKYGEEFGFNPLTLLGVSSPMGAGVAPENYMGQAIADAALLAADGLAKNKAAQQLERAERVNQKLQQQVTDLTIRPKVGGIYDQLVATPTLRQALGVEDGTSADSGPIPEAGDFGREGHSPLAGDDPYLSDDYLTGPQASVKKDVPAFRLFGHDFYGSGLFSTGEQMESSLGEGPFQWAYAPLVIGDAFANEAYKAGALLGEKVKKKPSWRPYIPGRHPDEEGFKGKYLREKAGKPKPKSSWREELGW